MMNKNGLTYIYSLSDENGDIRYIGKTGNIKRRLKDHITESKSNYTHKNNWISSLLKKNIIPNIEIIDEVPDIEWEYWEIHYISLFKSWGYKLTNKTIGGNGTGSGPSNPNYGKKLTEEHKRKCSLKLQGEKNPFFGKRHPEDVMQKIYKQVLQYSITGVFLKEWKSIKDAEDNLNIHSISTCCHNKILSAGGFVWKFKIDENYPININVAKTYRKPVLQFTTNNIFIKKWNSIKEAERETGAFHISKVCNNIVSHKTSGGFIWKFEN